MKNILFIMHSMPVGGAERVLIDILDNIDYTRYKVSLLLQHNDGGLQSYINKNVGVRCIYNYNRHSVYNLIRSRFVGVFRLKSIQEMYEKKKTRTIASDKYDAIISFCQGPAHKIHTYLTDRSNNNISWIHSDLSKGNWGVHSFSGGIKDQECAYNQMDQIVFVSVGAREAFNKIFNIKPSIKQPVLYNIVDKEKINKKAGEIKISKPEGKFVFINVGRLVDAKQQIRLLHAANIVKNKYRDFVIWILGEGPLRSELERYISDNRLEEYVKLWGNQMNPFAYVKASDAFVLSSRQEGFPMVVCEALILNKPTICTNIVGPTEVLENGKYGLMVDETADAIADAMMTFMESPEIRQRYTEAAMERAKTFQVTDFMHGFEKIVE